MTFTSFLIILVIGGLAGWLAGLLFKGSGFGLPFDILLGVVGGYVGSSLLAQLGVSVPGGALVTSFLTALIGASALILLAMLISRAFPRGRR